MAAVMGAPVAVGRHADIFCCFGTGWQGLASLPYAFEPRVRANDLRLTRRASAVADPSTASSRWTLAWLLAQGERHGIAVVPIPGTKKAARARDNVAAAQITLTPDDLAALEPIAEQVAGDRLPAAGTGFRFTRS